jgi:hypothetical protein
MTTDSHQPDQDFIRWLRRLTQLADGPVSLRLAELDRITERLTQLAGVTCTGHIWWRDKDTDKPKLYANHGIDQACPIHGLPQKGKRLRIYVGTDPDKQELALAQMRDETTRAELAQRHKGIVQSLRRAAYHISKFYAALGYFVPRQDQPALYPEPISEWKPPTTW